MRMLRDFIAKLAGLVATQRQLSRFICEGCELRDQCHLPSYRRQLCYETRALRPRW
jgi:hypothetical protein